MPNNVRSRNFCFTLFDNIDEAMPLLEGRIQLGGIRYLIAGKESCPTTRQRHLQGYVQFHDRKSLRAAKSFFEDVLGHRRTHLEEAKGGLEANQVYCKKEGDWIEAGQAASTGQGKRSDLSRVADTIKNGASLKQVTDEHPEAYIRYSKGIEKLISFRSKSRDFPTALEWYFGPTGTGKSRHAWTQYPDAYSKDPNTKWWDGYCGQETVILDDWRPNAAIPFNQMLRLADRYPLQVETKGGTVNFHSLRIIVTTPKSPSETLESLDWLGTEQKNQLFRRIGVCLTFPGQIPTRVFGEPTPIAPNCYFPDEEVLEV